MAEVVWFTADRGDCTMRPADGFAHLVFHPSGEDAYLQLDADLRAGLYRVIPERIGRVLLIRYRGGLELVTLEDLSSFGAPIMPADG